MISKDSYIYVDGDEIPEEERCIRIQCRNCFNKNKKGKLWKGANGYGGPVTCACGNVICKLEDVSVNNV